MRLSTRGRYGARFMVDLAIHGTEGPVLLKDLAKRQGISVKYLEQLVGPLRKAGLVTSKRGVRGGFQLSRPPEEIKMLDVVEAVEGSLSLVECVVHPDGCPRSTECITKEVWAKAASAIRDVLAGITLADMIGMKREKTEAKTHAHI
jgi:Rrf2 family iron-sulfur cluster assembly transcriptional regulator